MSRTSVWKRKKLASLVPLRDEKWVKRTNLQKETTEENAYTERISREIKGQRKFGRSITKCSLYESGQRLRCGLIFLNLGAGH